VLLAILAAAPLIPLAAASAPSAVADCSSHGILTHHYSVTQLRSALTAMPADVQEYTDCYNVIHNQLLAEIPGGHHSAGGSSSSGGGSSFPTALLAGLIVLVVIGAGAGAYAMTRRSGPPSAP